MKLWSQMQLKGPGSFVLTAMRKYKNFIAALFCNSFLSKETLRLWSSLFNLETFKPALLSLMIFRLWSLYLYAGIKRTLEESEKKRNKKLLMSWGWSKLHNSWWFLGTRIHINFSITFEKLVNLSKANGVYVLCAAS